LTNAVINVVLATLVVTHHVQLWHIYVTGFLAGTVQAFQQPARQTLISDMVGNEQIYNALALNSVALNASRAVGPAIAGLLIAWIGTGGSYYVQAALFIFATVWTIQMHVPDRAARTVDQAKETLFSGMKTGLAYVVKHRDVRTLMILDLAPVVLAMPYISLMPIFAKDVLHHGSRLQGLLLTSVGIGAFAGALVVASGRRRYGYAWPVVMGASCYGLALMGFAMSRWVPVSLVLAAIVGAFSVTYLTQDQTLLQIIAPRHLRGRVMSIFLLNRGMVPVGTLLAGALAEKLGGPRALLILSVSCVAVVALVVLVRPKFLWLKVSFQGEAEDVGTAARESASEPRQVAAEPKQRL